ncbi:hypothetical protein ACVBEF_05740 [Glaciimonas sp. GG7]
MPSLNHSIQTSTLSVDTVHKRVRLFALTFIAMTTILCAHPAMAAGSAKPDMSADVKAAYQQQRKSCLNGTSNQDRATCLKEAGAALEAARKGQLNDRPDQYQQNSLRRCNALPEKDRSDCVLRMQPGGVVEGSVESGGILRESVTTEVGPPMELTPAPSQ